VGHDRAASCQFLRTKMPQLRRAVPASRRGAPLWPLLPRCLLAMLTVCGLAGRRPHWAGGAAVALRCVSTPVATPPAVMRRAAVWALGAGVLPLAAHAGDEPWRSDLPRALNGLRGYQEQWSEINAEGLATAGANRVREGLGIRYTDVFTIAVPAGEPLGVSVDRLCQVTSVKSPALGWMEGDVIAAVNKIPTRNDDDLRQAVNEARLSQGSLQLTVQRLGPPLLENLENKLKDAYLSIVDDSLPELEDVQIAVSNTRGAATSAASAPSVSPETMRRLREEIDKLVALLTPIARAVK